MSTDLAPDMCEINPHALSEEYSSTTHIPTKPHRQNSESIFLPEKAEIPKSYIQLCKNYTAQIKARFLVEKKKKHRRKIPSGLKDNIHK